MCSDPKNNFVMPRKIQDKLKQTNGREKGINEMDLGLHKLKVCFLEALQP